MERVSRQKASRAARAGGNEDSSRPVGSIMGEERNTNLEGKFNLCSDGVALKVLPVLKIRTVFDLPLHDLR
jgi:hypothetical protein